MRSAVDDVLARSGGVATRSALLRAVSRAELDDEIRRGRLTAVFPRAYCRPWDVDLPRVRWRAALLSVDTPAGLSHLTALQVLKLPGSPAVDAVHVTTTYRRHPRCDDARLVVHRTRVRTALRDVAGLTVVAPAVAVATSWPLLAPAERRAPALAAIRDGVMTVADYRAALVERPGLPGRRVQLSLAELLDAGCESELEIWGHDRVFVGAAFAHGVRQLVVVTRAGRYRLDLAFVGERLAVELDGHAFHATREQRERDLRRDAALAAAGWLVIRFSHARLHGDPAGCRRDALAALAARRLARGA